LRLREVVVSGLLSKVPPKNGTFHPKNNSIDTSDDRPPERRREARVGSRQSSEGRKAELQTLSVKGQAMG